MIKLVLLPLWYGNKDIIRDNLSGRHIVENFDIVSIQHYPKEEEIHIHLDEKKSIPVEFSSRRVVFNGFTSAKKIQDYPIRGNAVYLQVRRRKWLDTETNEILTKTYSIAFEGTQLTKEFVSFLDEYFNAKVKAFRAQFRGVRDIPFFIFRLAKIFA